MEKNAPENWLSTSSASTDKQGRRSATRAELATRSFGASWRICRRVFLCVLLFCSISPGLLSLCTIWRTRQTTRHWTCSLKRKFAETNISIPPRFYLVYTYMYTSSTHMFDIKCVHTSESTSYYYIHNWARAGQKVRICDANTRDCECEFWRARSSWIQQRRATATKYDLKIIRFSRAIWNSKSSRTAAQHTHATYDTCVFTLQISARCRAERQCLRIAYTTPLFRLWWMVLLCFWCACCRNQRCLLHVGILKRYSCVLHNLPDDLHSDPHLWRATKKRNERFYYAGQQVFEHEHKHEHERVHIA